MNDKSCEERVDKHLESRLEDLRRLWEACKDGEEEVEDLGNMYDYGLSFDYVPKDAFEGQDESYFRYQLSWGGPSDEFRFYVNIDMNVYHIEYWFMDWFDGASRRLYNQDFDLLEEIFEWFKAMGVVQTEMEKANDE